MPVAAAAVAVAEGVSVAAEFLSLSVSFSFPSFSSAQYRLFANFCVLFLFICSKVFFHVCTDERCWHETRYMRADRLKESTWKCSWARCFSPGVLIQGSPSQFRERVPLIAREAGEVGESLVAEERERVCFQNSWQAVSSRRVTYHEFQTFLFLGYCDTLSLSSGYLFQTRSKHRLVLYFQISPNLPTIRYFALLWRNHTIIDGKSKEAPPSPNASYRLTSTTDGKSD